MKLYKPKRLLISLILAFFIITSIYSTIYADNQDLNILSQSVILIDNNTENIIYSKNPDKRMYPASTTKIMTAILVIEKGNLQDITTVSKSAISSIPSGYSIANLIQGEKISIENLLKVLLIHSANDAANVLAEYVSGSVAEFTKLMNEKANEIGCLNTHFVNANGIQNTNHYSTASDLAKIAQYCMKNEQFRQIVSMSSCTIPATNKSKQRTYSTTNDAIIKDSGNYMDDCIGIKTGYTSQAGYCIISAFKKDDFELIAVILSAANDSYRYTDMKTLSNYGYTILEQQKIQKEKEKEEKILAEQIAIQEALSQIEATYANPSQISTENLFEQSFIEKLLKDELVLIFVRIILIIAILLLVFIILFIKLKPKKKYLEEKYEETEQKD